jgi:hypothetical protein
MLKQIALKSKKEDIPKTIVIISDMEIDSATRNYWGGNNNHRWTKDSIGTEMENLRKEWAAAGLTLPRLVYWNVQARHDNVPMDIKDGVTLVSGFSPVLFEQIMKGKTAYDLMFDKLDSDRYACIK